MQTKELAEDQTTVLFRTMAVNRNVLIQMIPISVDAKKVLDLIRIRKHAKEWTTVQRTITVVSNCA